MMGGNPMSSWLVYVIIAVVVIAALAFVLSLIGRRRRRTATTIGLPDLGEVSADAAADPSDSGKRDEPTSTRPHSKS
jgi:hypothetical protein